MGINRCAAAIAAFGVVMGGAVGLAGPASADPPSGTYTATVVGGSGHFKQGATQNVVLTPCGPDCVHINKPPGDSDLRLQGAAFTGTYAEDKSFGPCTFALDAATLNLNEQCPAFDLSADWALVPS